MCGCCWIKWGLTVVKRIKNQQELAEVRARLLTSQGGLDPLTGLPVRTAFVDHDHATGHVRGVLDRASNTLEGKVAGAFRRYMSHVDKSDWPKVLVNLSEYWAKDYSENPHYPNHLTVEVKQFARLTSSQQCFILTKIGCTDDVLRNQVERSKAIRKFLQQSGKSLKELLQDTKSKA